jgi:hypothetical protein
VPESTFWTAPGVLGDCCRTFFAINESHSFFWFDSFSWIGAKNALQAAQTKVGKADKMPGSCVDPKLLRLSN